MRTMIVAAALAASLLPLQAQAQTAPPSAAAREPDALAEAFFGAIKRGKPAEALDILKSNSPMLAAKLMGTEEAAIDKAIVSYGPIARWERTGSELLGTMVRRDTYILQHREFVTRWRLTYVRTSKGWTVASFAFEDQVASWFVGGTAP